MVMQLVHRYSFVPEAYTGTCEEIEEIIQLLEDIILFNLGREFSDFISYSYGDTDVEFSKSFMDVIVMTMHREDYPYTVYSYSKYLPSFWAKYVDRYVEEDLSIMYPNNHGNEDIRDECDDVYILNIISVADLPEVLLNEETSTEMYNWYGRVDLWHEDAIGYKDIEKRDIPGFGYYSLDEHTCTINRVAGCISELNRCHLDFLTDELINSFDSYESIDISIGYKDKFYW